MKNHVKHILIATLFSSVAIVAWSSNGISLSDSRNHKQLYGLASGNFWSSESALYENKKGTLKKAAFLDGVEGRLEWESIYTNFTFSNIGLGFAFHGVNEKGLHAQVFAFKNPAPPAAKAKFIQPIQWIQYMLDTQADLKGVIHETVKAENFIQPIGANGSGLRFLVCDAQAACASFDFDEKQVAIYTSTELIVRLYDTHSSPVTHEYGNFLPVPVATNTPYDQSIGQYLKCKMNWMQDGCFPPEDSQGRFNKLADWFLDRTNGNDTSFESPEEYLFLALSAVDQGFPLTSWTTVLSMTATRIEYLYKLPRTKANRFQKITLPFSNQSCDGNSRLWPTDFSAEPKDRTLESIEFTAEHQLHMAMQHANKGGFPKEAIEYIANYPSQNIKCKK